MSSATRRRDISEVFEVTLQGTGREWNRQWTEKGSVLRALTESCAYTKLKKRASRASFRTCHELRSLPSTYNMHAPSSFSPTVARNVLSLASRTSICPSTSVNVTDLWIL